MEIPKDPPTVTKEGMFQFDLLLPITKSPITVCNTGIEIAIFVNADVIWTFPLTVVSAGAENVVKEPPEIVTIRLEVVFANTGILNDVMVDDEILIPPEMVLRAGKLNVVKTLLETIMSPDT